MKNDDYTNTLENVIRQMLRPIRNVPFNLVIEALSGHKVIPFDSNNNKDKSLLDNLISVAIEAGKTVNNGGIRRTRPNEVGNDIEPFVKDALIKNGYRADVPRTAAGKKKQRVILI